jgi:two-component system sensor histidine kinase VicK
MILADSLTTYVEENTEVIYGDENITNDTLKVHSAIKEYLDICNDSKGPSMFVIPNHPMTNSLRELKEIGIRLRFISEITKDNVEYCKELMKTFELRHLDEIKGNFGIADGIYYRASARSKLSSPPPLLICSTLRAFVEQQQYFFDMLWKKAIPAKQRIKEIEEDLKREFIETIQDSEETLVLTSKVLSSATEEILIIFSHLNTLRQYEKYGILDLLRKKADNDVVVRILIGVDYPIIEKALESVNGYRNIELRYKSIRTKLTTIITDRQLSLVIEEKENEDTIGFATYSNSESTVMSYASIFENLWGQSINNNNAM